MSIFCWLCFTVLLPQDAKAPVSCKSELFPQVVDSILRGRSAAGLPLTRFLPGLRKDSVPPLASGTRGVPGRLAERDRSFRSTISVTATITTSKQAVTLAVPATVPREERSRWASRPGTPRVPDGGGGTESFLNPGRNGVNGGPAALLPRRMESTT